MRKECLNALLRTNPRLAMLATNCTVVSHLAALALQWSHGAYHTPVPFIIKSYRDIFFKASCDCDKTRQQIGEDKNRNESVAVEVWIGREKEVGKRKVGGWRNCHYSWHQLLLT